MNETWKDVLGYEGLYQVSDAGNVRSVDRRVPYGNSGATIFRRGRDLSPCPHNRTGHLQVSLWKNGEGATKRIHNLVTETFSGPKPKGTEVLHGPNGISDNSVDNLRYGTHQENAMDCRRDGTHGGKAALRSDGVEYMSIKMAAEESGCERTCIHAVLSGKQKTCGGFGWRYK